MSLLVFTLSCVSACIGYLCAVTFNHRQIKSAQDEATAMREDARIGVELDRKELNDFVRYVQSMAASVDGNMDRHASQVATVNEAVVGNANRDPLVVLRAAKQLLEANVQLQAELNSAREQIGEKQQQLESYMAEARTDALTGVSNRRAFDQEIRRQFSQRQRQGTIFSLLLIDVDHFKLFNDYHGHQVGDEMLRQVATTFDRTMREMDLVCRYGGEEFAIILPGTKLKDAIRAAQRARAAVERVTYRLEDADLRVTVSVGAVEVRQGEVLEEFIQRGDSALYAAKLAGRNCVSYHDGQQAFPDSVPVASNFNAAPAGATPNLDQVLQAVQPDGLTSAVEATPNQVVA